ncbi:MAG: SgcJ/EcaC family oxidoreductase [Acidobacteriota bacterium]
MLKFTIGSFAGFLLLAGCNSAPPAPTTHAVDIFAEQGKIRDLETAWSAAAAAKDLDKSVSYYADDAVVMAPGAPAAKGKEAIRAAWKEMLADPKSKLSFSTDQVTVSASGDLAATKGSYTMTMTNPKTKKPMEDKGSYATVYKKQSDGNWKAVEGINVSEVAPK